VALAEVGGTSQGSGVAFLVSAGIVYEIIAANCSSPQTTELNADKRAPTLMKWVNLGLGQAALFVGAAMLFDRAHAGPILAGGLLAGAMLWVLYGHAKQSGLTNGGAPTETY
jgi:hypothetical protein